MATSILIGDRRVGPGEPAYLIAEVAQAHDGSLGLAHSFIDAAAAAGADAVKFQTHIAEAESTRDEQWRVRFSRQDASRFDYWRRMEFTPEQWSGLAEHAREKGLTFLSTAFSEAAVELLAALGAPAWKVGSGEYGSRSLLAAMTATGKPILLSTGMSAYAEIAEGVEYVRSRGGELAILQCTSLYPTPLEKVGLNVLDELRASFGCPVGLSDHTGKLWPAVAAIARGANIVEAHVTFDRAMFGPDASSSLTFAEFRQLREARDAIAALDANPVDKDRLAEELGGMRRLFSKSLAPVRPLPAGTVLSPEMLTSKKPGDGVPPERLAEVVGRRLRRPVGADRVLRFEDLDA